MISSVFKHVLLALPLAFFLVAGSFYPASAAEFTEPAFKQALKESLGKNPNLVMGVLRGQSEEVLRIAQSEGKAGPAADSLPQNAPKSISLAETSPAFVELEFKQMLAKVLKENPDLVMDVLRKQPLEVLRIAQQGNEERKKQALKAQWKEDAKKPKIFKIENRPMRGAPNAPVLIAVYSDFSCPHCARASLVIEDFLINNPTKAHFVFKHRPLSSHKYSRIASLYFIAASMQNDIKAWALYKGLYAGREELMEKGEEFIIPLAQKVGLDMDRLKADVNSAQALRILEEDMAEAKEFGFDGAPYILLNNLVLAGAPSPEILAAGVEEAMRYK